ncbi:prorelaxin H1 [Notolabrus celidotus]|uniref:prorelaxin H1 n=1 Tax=Notolabrus celidotus TaxID=1203425 RepID=UPI00149086C7|nr:prorelaxin H1 [Notolabrus celidotus]
MLWRLSLALAVVCVSGIRSSVKADVMSKLIIPRDYGVKLCGREFIRAVIFTCGGSRWKRSTEGDSVPSQWSSFRDVTVEDRHQTWQPAPELSEDNLTPPHVASSYSLADLLALFGAGQHSTRDPEMVERSQPLMAWGEQDEHLAAGDWLVSSKRKRNFSLGVAGKCCSQGCTKNDIGRLC